MTTWEWHWVALKTGMVMLLKKIKTYQTGFVYQELLKYNLILLNLNGLYLTDIRLLLECGCKVWNNCVVANSEPLQKLHVKQELLHAYIVIATMQSYF